MPTDDTSDVSDHDAIVNAWTLTLTETELEEALAFARANRIDTERETRLYKQFCIMRLEREIHLRRDELMLADDLFVRALDVVQQARERFIEACDVADAIAEADQIDEVTFAVFMRSAP